MFENIFGNNSIKKVLEQSIYSNKVSHSYLMIGISGIGKKMIATEFAKGILCLSENKSCNYCKSCIEFDGNNNPDFLCIEPEGSSIKIGQIRELQKRIQEKPIISEKKVYIIDQADLMTKEAQNCLLKTLEEPPEFATIILVGTNENAFLTTIKSRCMILHFNPIEDMYIKKYLDEKYQIKNIVNSWWSEVVPTGFSSLFSSKSKYEFHINGRVTTIEESLNDELLLYKGITNLLNCSKYVEVCKVDLNYIYSAEFQAYIDAVNRMSLTECSYISFTLMG